MADPFLFPHPTPLASGWPTDRILPEGFLPMLASPASGPLDSGEHAYEVKWEGLRVLAGVEGPELAVRTGTGQDARFWFPELEQLREASEPRWVLVDGEFVQLAGGRANPAALQTRLRAPDQATVERLRHELPVTLMVYDILRIGDSWLLDVTWEERRDILTRAFRDTERIKIAPVFPTGQEALQHARELGLESVMAKRLRGRYTPGEKTRDWLSIRPLEVVETVICGWTEGRGARSGTIGSLILGMRQQGRLVYIGHTGTGLDAQMLHDLHAALESRRRRTSPFETIPHLTGEPHWVEPDLACRVRIQGWTEGGHLRGPTFLGLVEPLTAGSAQGSRA